MSFLQLSLFSTTLPCQKVIHTQYVAGQNLYLYYKFVLMQLLIFLYSDFIVFVVFLRFLKILELCTCNLLCSCNMYGTSPGLQEPPALLKQVLLKSEAVRRKSDSECPSLCKKSETTKILCSTYHVWTQSPGLKPSMCLRKATDETHMKVQRCFPKG